MKKKGLVQTDNSDNFRQVFVLAMAQAHFSIHKRLCFFPLLHSSTLIPDTSFFLLSLFSYPTPPILTHRAN